MNKIYRKKEISRIVGCKPTCRCERAERRYGSTQRWKNCRNANHFAPYRVKIVYLGESPPGNRKYIYDPRSTGEGNFTNLILRDLQSRAEFEEFNEIVDVNTRGRKKDFLNKLKSNGVVVLDCASCALGKSSDVALRDCFVREGHSGGILSRICDNHKPDEIACIFKKGRDDLYRFVRWKYDGTRTRRIRWR